MAKKSKAAKSANVVKTTRTNIVKMIHGVGGCFFGCTHVGKDDELHHINGKYDPVQDNALGYIKVKSMQKGGAPRLINPQTVTEFRFKGTTYQAK